jgi:hypothetical protein
MKPVVERFLTQEESPYNSVDFVEAPGADGRIVARAVESAQEALANLNVREMATFSRDTIKPPKKKAAKESVATPPRHNKEDDSMDEAERTALAEQVATATAAAVAEALNRPRESDPQLTIGQQTEAVLAAGLTESGRAAVYERIGRGEAVEAAVAAEKAREDQMRAEMGGGSSAAEEEDSRTHFGYTVEAARPASRRPRARASTRTRPPRRSTRSG